MITAGAVIGLSAAALPMLASPPANATPPQHLSVRFEGCRGSVDSFPPSADQESEFVCPDSEYTTGNLGTGWNELDLVPHRLTASLSSQAGATTNYTLNVVADNQEAGRPGYDYLSAPLVNAAKSDASCSVSASALKTKTPGIGGTDQSMYRTLSIQQDKGKTCVFDWVERLALGSHLYPGASLHSNLTQEDFTTGGIGARDVSIPVNEIQPQSISKDMTASQGASYVWNVTKSATPANLTFADTCSSSESRSARVQITVNWEKLPAVAGGPITVVTNVYATNPAHRTITVNVSDQIRSGTTVLDTVASGAVDVPANVASYKVMTHETTVPDGTTDLNDVATATYTDKVTGIAIPGSTTATASATVQQSGPISNDTAVITDVESLTGNDLRFSADSFSPAVGSFGNGYVAGTPTTGDVSWTSVPQSGAGSVTFQKTVYVTRATQESGTLADTATLTGAQGFTASADASVSISTNATVTLGIKKQISAALAEDHTFTFKVTGPNFDRDVSVTVPKGTTGATVADVGQVLGVDLQPGAYAVTELSPGAGWQYESAPKNVDLSLPVCDAQVSFTNSFGPATAQAVKITDPGGPAAGWQMCLYALGIPTAIECGLTGANGVFAFSFLDFADGVTYEIRETAQTGWDQTNSTGCTFTVNYPDDADKVFTCTKTNTKRGTVTVMKTTSGQAPPAGAFTFQIRTGASPTQAGTIVVSDTNDATGLVDFNGQLLVPGAYQICEAAMLPGWKSSLTAEAGAFVPDADDPLHDNSVVCVPFTLDPGENQAFTVDNTPPPGGEARTIGYWRNWSSCSGGRQKPVLDETLAKAGGILIGDLLVDTCKEATSILSKRDLNGTIRASDPAFNLAAQLLAARLNVVADAGVCLKATQAMSDAQALLAAADFDGVRTFRYRKGGPTPGAIDAQVANSLASTLDAYNNNELC
jgi:hypothetical protein